MQQFCFRKKSMPILNKMTQIDGKLSAIVAYIYIYNIYVHSTQDFQELMHYIFAMYLTSIELWWATESALA